MSQFKCKICPTEFKNSHNFRRHVQNFHPDKLDDPIKKKNWNFQCDQCPRNFSQLHNFKYHQRHAHGDGTPPPKVKHKCVICEFEDFTKSLIIEHYIEFHKIVLESEELDFDNLEDFKSWKLEMEKYTNSLFVKGCGSYTEKNTAARRIRFSCHRSGSYRARGKGLRKLKNQGSKKINGVCPAALDVYVKGNGKCKVTYVKSHVGHDNDLRHQPLTKGEREEIAAKIAADVPFRVILDEIRDSVSTNDKLERTHLITRKDLYNIVKGFKLEDESRIAADGLNIEDWVNEMSDKGCVLYYKFKGTFCEKYVDLKPDDFVLIIMNQGQTEMLEKYGTNCICIDRTHNVNADQMELISLLVLDDIDEGFPCAFLISNRIDEDTICLFYSCIREKMETTIEPKIFMSDIEEYFYSAWLTVMDPPMYRFFCSWHVENAWRDNIVTVASKNMQATILETLTALMNDENIKTFVVALESFVGELTSDEMTVDFAYYFRQHFANSWESWAKCYKVQNCINLDTHFESEHDTISRLYLFGKKFKRPSMAVTSVMKFVKDRLYEVMSRCEGVIRTSEKDDVEQESNALVAKEIFVIKDENLDNVEVEYPPNSDSETSVHKAIRSSPPKRKNQEDENLRVKKEKLLSHISNIIKECSSNEELDTIKRLVGSIHPTLKIVRRLTEVQTEELSNT